MPVTTYVPRNNIPDQGVAGINDAMLAVKSNTNYFEHPDAPAGRVVISRAIRLSIATEDVSLVMQSGRTIIYPAGTLAAGVPHPIRCVRVNSTGTGGTVAVVVEFD